MERKTGKTGYREVADTLAAKIEKGDYPVGEALPSLDAIATEYGVTRNIARYAYYTLRDAGIIRIDPGIGSEVLRTPSQAAAETSPEQRITRELEAIRQRIDALARDLADLRGELQQPHAQAHQADDPTPPAQP